MLVANIVFWYCLALMASAVAQPVLRERWNIHLHPPDRFSLSMVTWGRHSLSLMPWKSPGLLWRERGYDGHWFTWACYPLVEYECLDRYTWESLQEDN